MNKCNLKIERCPESPILNTNNIQKLFVRGGNNFRISVKVSGNPHGIPVVFIHGYSEAWLLWNFQFASPLLLRKYRLIAIDMRGQGESQPKSFNPQDYIKGTLYANDIASVFKRLQLKNAIVVAHSRGGTWLTTYLKYFGPNRISGIILVSSRVEINTPFANEVLTPQARSVIPLLTNPCLQVTAEGVKQFVSLLTNCTLSRSDVQTVLSYIALVPSQVRGLLNLEEPVTLQEVWPQIKLPVLIIQSKDDAIIKFKAAIAINRVIPNSKILALRTVGHSPFAEIPVAFNLIVDAFIKNISCYR
ncbi:alpha/beta fold hydrolase [Mechercharimyces sp. CAU 1602]|uniref:alpha/beta fold hydrolase n=1 Tax=Mechercharimyces sp. CAU 1602 TaxID=2973933 RepID=UPI0021632F55|nr:alpha/beta hydrolase [Mechercharimyces sp. CAU 1602]MCS1351347.1 alpha/beta hydrolase [Mechercharimyces sp. CAU 1602]